MLKTWTKGFPTEEGYYWFYGYIFGPPQRWETPRLEQFQVRRVSNGLVYFTEAAGLNQREMLGFYQKMQVPDTQGLADFLPKPPKEKK